MTGSMVSSFPGWGHFSGVVCPGCGQRYEVVAPLNSQGFTCRHCNFADPTWEWLDPRQHPFGHDGAWLTGELRLPGCKSPDGQDEEDNTADCAPKELFLAGVILFWRKILGCWRRLWHST